MNTKKWYQSRTMWLSIATAITGILMTVSQSIQETGGESGVLIAVIGIANGLLRYVTSQPIK